MKDLSTRGYTHEYAIGFRTQPGNFSHVGLSLDNAQAELDKWLDFVPESEPFIARREIVEWEEIDE